MSYTAKDVQALRQATGAGMMDAKKALTEAGGDFEAAVQLLRERGLAKAGERQDRANNEGAIALASNAAAAAIVQIRTETDFTAKSEGVLTLVKQLAETVLADGEGAIDASVLDDLKLTTKENLALGTVVRIEAGAGNQLDTYLHTQDGRGINAVVIEGSGIDQETLHEEGRVGPRPVEFGDEHPAAQRCRVDPDEPMSGTGHGGRGAGPRDGEALDGHWCGRANPPIVSAGIGPDQRQPRRMALA